MTSEGRRREKVFPVLPTLLTLGNAVCGFGAITFATKVGPVDAEDNSLLIAGLLIFLAMILDALDGHVARWTNQTTQFGAQLDSLCDAISFGVAPGLLMLKFPQVYHPLYHPRLLWVIAMLFMVCAVLRLARFNLESADEDTHDSFTGLPSPAAAGAIASLTVALPGVRDLMDPAMMETTQVIGSVLMAVITRGLPVFTLILACLMVSRIRYPHVSNQVLRGRESFRQILQLVFATVAVLALHNLAIPLIFCYFVLAPPLRAIWAKLAVYRSWARLQPSDGTRS